MTMRVAFRPALAPLAGLIMAISLAPAVAQDCGRAPDAAMRVAVVGPPGTSVAGSLAIDGVGLCVLGLSLNGETAEPWSNEGQFILREACLFAGQQLDNRESEPPDGAYVASYELAIDVIRNLEITRAVDQGEADFCDVYDAVIEIDDKGEARFVAAVG
jgi:hypothetical protein